MTITIGKFFRAGASVIRKRADKNCGLGFGAELKIGKRSCSISFCSWVKCKNWKIRKEVPVIPNDEIRFYSWRKFTIMVGKEK